MKKLILAAAVVCIAAVSQAAAVGWNCTATNWKSGSYSVFVVGMNGVTGVDQIKAIVAAGGLSKADSYAFYSGGSVTTAGLATKTATDSGKAIAYKSDGDAAANTYTAFMVIQSSAGDKASYTATKDLTLENDSTSKSWGFSNQNTALASNTFTVNTPEPTSGVLLLLGMAGLALKRKRA